MEKPNNPPAFPAERDEFEQHSVGMTLLDYFAARAMRGPAYGFTFGPDDSRNRTAKKVAEEQARAAYRTAAAMLKEREKHL